MMNYRAYYNIVKSPFGKEGFSDSVLVIGVLNHPDILYYEMDLSFIYANEKPSMTLCSRLGGGIGYPSVDSVKKIMWEDHMQSVETFISAIEEKEIVFYDDGDLYALTMMALLAFYAKKHKKYVTCISAPPFQFEGRKRNKTFLKQWEEVEAIADKNLYFDLSGSDNTSIKEAFKAKHYAMIEEVKKYMDMNYGK